MEAKVTWKGGLDFDGVAKSGFSLDLSGSSEAGGSEDGFRPMELMALGLAGCTAMDVVSILLKMHQEISEFQVHVHPEFASKHPLVWTNVHIEYHLTGKAIDPKAVERAIDLSTSVYCPVLNMLHTDVEIITSYEILDTNSV